MPALCLGTIRSFPVLGSHRKGYARANCRSGFSSDSGKDVPEPGIGRPDIGKTKRKIPPAWGVARNLAHAAQTHLLRIFRGSFSEIGRLTSQIIVIRRRTFAVMRPTTIQSREDLLALLRDRREELDLSLEVLAEIAGLPARYPNKLLSLKPTRNLGPLSMSVILGALALKIVRV